MNGVINIYKEAGYSSFHIIYELRKLTGEQKVGHTGTLDPQVCGVLPVCLGKATKLVGQLTDTDKTYRCTMLLGRSTDTQDCYGNTVNEMSQDEIYSILTKDRNTDPLELVTKVLESFKGEIMQIPPMYSALKVGGMKLVNAARKGIEVERKPRKKKIYSIDSIRLSDNMLYVSFNIKCSKGTYIRTICHDAGELLGIPSCMYELERTSAAGLGTDSAITLDQAKEFYKLGRLDEYIIPSDRFLEEYPALKINDDIKRKVIYGNSFCLNDTDLVNDNINEFNNTTFRVYDNNGDFYALYRYDKNEETFKCVKMFRDI